MSQHRDHAARADLLRWLLDDRGMRPASFARELGASRQRVSRWLVDGVVPKPAMRARIAAVLGVSEHVLWPLISEEASA